MPRITLTISRQRTRGDQVLSSLPGYAGSKGRPGNARPGFSMIELMVVIGVILVLIGLIVPVVGRSIEQARNTADMATLRSNMALVMQYASQDQGHYPLATPTRCSADTKWFLPLIENGLLNSAAQADPRSYHHYQTVSFAFSQSLVADPVEFTWGSTRPCRESPTSPVTDADVSFPSSKGMMYRYIDPERIPPYLLKVQNGHGGTFCCADLWTTPVGFCDGSAQLGTFMDFAPPGGVALAHGHQVGVPIGSPWGGFHARER